MIGRDPKRAHHRQAFGAKHVKTDPQQVGIGADVQQSKQVLLQALGLLVPDALVIRQSRDRDMLSGIKLAAAAGLFGGGSGCPGRRIVIT